MEHKDNANPIVYQSGSSSTQRRASSAANAEWWRDHSIHSSAHTVGRASASLNIAGLAAATSAASTTSGSNLAASFARATRSTIDQDDDDDDDDDDEQYQLDVQDEHDDVAMRSPHRTSSSPPTSSPESQTPGSRAKTATFASAGSDETIDSQEIYDLVRSVTDPEHPLTLEQLAVVNASHITVSHGDASSNTLPHVLLEFTPTIPHCSMATLIGLSLRVRLLRALPDRFKVDIRVRPGTHQSENAVNKQLNDKERVAAALENSHLFNVVQGCLASAGRRGKSADEIAGYLNPPPAADGAHDQHHHNIWKTVEEITTRMGIAV